MQKYSMLSRLSGIAFMAAGVLLLLAQGALAGPMPTLDQALCNTDSCKTFVDAVKSAGLDGVLQGRGPITVFVPSDEAFKNLKPGEWERLMKPENHAELKKFVQMHLAYGKLGLDLLPNMQSAKTLHGKLIAIHSKKDGIYIGKKAKIQKADIACGNGMIHVIDKVLTP